MCHLPVPFSEDVATRLFDFGQCHVQLFGGLLPMATVLLRGLESKPKLNGRQVNLVTWMIWAMGGGLIGAERNRPK